ncbi:hypothetical protein Zmor_021437 [Zophobas morio]|uniref:Tyr recombinase domain-containing protein n=1 Tax=Zophobas morio TaxID=2755281 RepID=A0AA38I5R5_9CUCU|nr:hypothetical protein Zmor_021437 [Zophobas morio]
MYRDRMLKKTPKTVGVWSAWSPWTPCSRSCGGGVTQQTRHCVSRPADSRFVRRQRRRRQANGCVGLYKRIHLCNTQSCPSGADFRYEQCAAFNNRIFKGRTYVWEPFLNAPDECALNCRASGLNFYATLNKTVIDGTSCKHPMISYGRPAPSGTRGICIEGSCKNTRKSHSSVWSQFENFCSERNYILQASTTPEEISNILMDYAYNMKKVDGSDYKESCVKTMWNVTAKLVQEKFFNEYQISINPFNDLCFKKARNARDSKRRELQAQADKRKVSSVALTEEELMKIKNFKTAQGGNHRLEDSKWLTTNKADLHMCPVRVLTLLLSKRTPNITCERLFLTVNPYWKKSSSSAWYKNTPIGRNEINKWTRCAAEEIGIDTKRVKITNHSTRSTVVSHLVKAGISEHQLIKITGHKNTTSLKPYLKVDQEHHKKIVDHMQGRTATQNAIVTSGNFSSEGARLESEETANKIVYNNCTFEVTSCNNDCRSTWTLGLLFIRALYPVLTDPKIAAIFSGTYSSWRYEDHRWHASQTSVRVVSILRNGDSDEMIIGER